MALINEEKYLNLIQNNSRQNLMICIFYLHLLDLMMMYNKLNLNYLMHNKYYLLSSS